MNTRGIFEPETGKWLPIYSPDELEVLKDWIKSGTSLEAFAIEVQKMFGISMHTGIKWYTRINKLVKAEK